MKGLDNAIEGSEDAKGKSIMVLGKSYFFGIIAPEAFESLNSAFAELVAEKKVKLMIENNPKKPRKLGHIGFGCMRFAPEVAATVEKIFKDQEFTE